MDQFRVWAPDAEHVEVVIDGADSQLTRGQGGWWSSEAAPTPGQRYAFRVDGSDPRPDPRSLSQPEGVDAASEVIDLDAHAWGDTGWVGSPLLGSVIYELHVGTFTPEGTFAAAIERLGHLVDLGVTMIELLPVAAFPGARGWGYDGVDLYAVHSAYGGAAGLQQFVDAAHQRGLAVCLDVVYNHLGPSGNYLSTFGPYFTDRHSTPWGEAVNLDGPGSDEVRTFIVDNALMWLRDFHLDALRLDAVHALLDDRAVHILEELSTQVDALSAELGRPLTLIAESDRNDPATVSRRGLAGDGGLGLHGQWVDDVHHALHVLLTGETQGYYADFAAPEAIPKTLAQSPFFHDGTYSSFRGRHHGRVVDPAVTPGQRFVASLQTHDQIGNRATGERLSQLVSAGRAAGGAALLLTAPWTPMLFMGEEWAAGTPWQYFTDHTDPELAAAVSRGRAAEFAEHGWGQQVPDPQAHSTFTDSALDWSELDDPAHQRMIAWYRSLLQLRARVPELHSPDFGSLASGDGVQVRDGLIEVRRGRFRVVVNLGGEPVQVPVSAQEALVLAWDAQLDAAAVAVSVDGTAIIGPSGELG